MNRALMLCVLVLVLSAAEFAAAQEFTVQPEYFRTELIRAKGLDTIIFERHAGIAVSEISDDSALIYHEPLPDNTMPKTAIDIGTLTIQAESSDEVVEILEERARQYGADWVIGFNEPRRKRVGDDYIYRSQARLFRVLDPTLVAGSTVQAVNVLEERIPDLASAYLWVSHFIVEHAQDEE